MMDATRQQAELPIIRLDELSANDSPSDAKTGRPHQRFRFFGLCALCFIAMAAIATSLFAAPAVDTYELQRRDRQPPAETFVDQAYRSLLNRDPDALGGRQYVKMYQDEGPEAVVMAILSSPEFQAKRNSVSAKWLTDQLSGQEVSHDADTASLARQYVKMYDSGALPLPKATDFVGRIGFATIILCVLAIIAGLHLRERSAHFFVAQRIFIPADLVVGLFSALAVMFWTYRQFTVESFFPGTYGYLEWLSRVVDLSLSRGPTNVWTPYPQGTQLLLSAMKVLSNSAAVQISSDIWTAYTVFRAAFQLGFLVIPSIAVVWLVYRIGSSFDAATATLAAVTVAFSFAPVYYGISDLNVADPLVVCVTVIGLWAIMRRRFALAGLAIGVATTLKLFPFFLLPVALLVCKTQKERIRTVLPAAIVLLLILAPFALANWDIFMSPYRWQSSRPPWESLYSFVNWLVGATHEYRSPQFEDISVGQAYGWVFWGITPRLTALVVAVPQGQLRWEDTASFLGTTAILVAGLAAIRIDSPRAVARCALLFLAGFLVFAIGWSPQYELYLLPVIVLAFRRPTVGVCVALLLEALTFLEYPLLLPWAYHYGESAVWLMWATLIGRYVLLIWLCIYVLVSECRWLTLKERIALTASRVSPLVVRGRP